MWATGAPRKKIAKHMAWMTTRYANASPYKLPEIPKGVGEYIDYAKNDGLTLIEAMRWHMMPDWVLDHSEEFALAWLLGEWEEA